MDRPEAIAAIAAQTNMTAEEWQRVEQAVANRLLAYGKTAPDIDLANAKTLPAFMGMAGIGRLFGVAESTCRVWNHRGKLPSPDEIIDGTHKVWARSTIKEWIAEIKKCK